MSTQFQPLITLKTVTVIFTREANHKFDRLRQTDVKAGHFERKVQALENERDQWEAKYEELNIKYTAHQKQLEDLQHEIGNI